MYQLIIETILIELNLSNNLISITVKTTAGMIDMRNVLIDFLTFRNTYLICDILRRTIQSCEFRYVNVNRFKRKLQIRKSSMRYTYESLFIFLSTIFIRVQSRRHTYC